MTDKVASIMLIDDDDADNFLHKMIIEEMNITENIMVAEDGAEAMAILTTEGQKQPDIIFLDINMPKMNGWEFLEAYQNADIKDKARTIIAMLTTSINPDDKIKALEKFSSLVRGYFNKPLTPEILNDVLEQHIKFDQGL
jgi:CheY-like chemotaxis protein